MNKRQLLATAALGAAALPSWVHAKEAAKSVGPALLTVTGAIGRANCARSIPRWIR
jgi:Mn2+/Fe2+ NRAMP family transporter